jgi:hypothetical protein
MRLQRDDGAVVYLNGTEVFRSNLPAGAVDSSTLASVAVGGADEATFHHVTLDPAILVSGTNAIAVELHQATVDSSDLGVDLELSGEFCTAGGDPSLIFADGFESGNAAAWDMARNPLVTRAAAIDGAYGFEVRVPDARARFVQDESPQMETSYRARFALDPNSIFMLNNQAFDLFQAFGTGFLIRDLASLELRKWQGAYQIRALVRKNNNSSVQSNWIPIDNAPNRIELDWQAATGPGANDGFLKISVNGHIRASMTGLDNDERFIEFIRLGLISGYDLGTFGSFYIDSFESHR